MVRCVIWCAVSSRAQNEPDKISLPDQEADSRALAEGNGWEIVDVLRVPGHSRRYIDFHELAADAAKEGVDAFYRLKAHWEAKDFDVLIIRDGDRFARTQALHAYITEQVIHSGAAIFSLADGLVDESNFRLWIAMGGYKAAGDMDRFVAARSTAMTDLAKRGLPITSRILYWLVLALLSFITLGSSTYIQSGNPSFVSSIAWSPQGDQIAVGMGAEICRDGNADYSVHILNALTGELTTQLFFHVCTVESVDWSPDGGRLVSSGGIDDRVAVVWDTTTWNSTAASPPPMASLGRITDIWNSDGNRLVGIADADPQIRIWDAITGHDLLTFNVVAPTAVVWNPDGNRVAIGESSGQLGIWDAATGTILVSFVGQNSTVTSVDWSPDGSRLVTGGMDGSIRVWSIDSGATMTLTYMHVGAVTRVVWNPVRQQIASAGIDGVVQVWNIETGTQLQNFQSPGSVTALDWNPTGDQLAYGGAIGVGESIIQIQQVNLPASATALIPTATISSTAMSTEIPSATLTSPIVTCTFTVAASDALNLVNAITVKFRRISRLSQKERR